MTPAESDEAGAAAQESLAELNGEWHDTWRGRPLAECRAELEAAHTELMDALIKEAKLS